MAGDVRPVAQVVNSRETHPSAIVRTIAGIEGGLPGVPKSDGSTAVMPASATRRPKSATRGVMPGTSCMITTPGPVPRR